MPNNGEKQSKGAIKIPLGRELVRAISRHGMSADYPDYEQWVIAREIESSIRTRFYQGNLTISGPPVDMMFNSGKEILLLSKRLDELEALTSNGKPWIEKKQFDIFISANNLIESNLKKDLAGEVKTKAEKISNLMVSRCARMCREMISGIPEGWLPELLCDWESVDKGRASDQREDLVRINLKSMINDDGLARTSYYGDELSRSGGSDSKGFFSSRWEPHVITAACFSVSHAARVKCDLLGIDVEKEEFPVDKIYNTIRANIGNPLLRDIGVKLGPQGNISIGVPSLT